MEPTSSLVGNPITLLIERIAYLGIGFFLIAALFLGLRIKNIGSAWIFLWSVSSGLGFFLIARWFWWRINSWSEISALISSIAISLIFYILDFYGTIEISFTFKLLIIPISIVIGLLTTFFTPPEDSSTLKHFYQKIRPNGFWKFSHVQTNNENPFSPILSSLMLASSILILIYAVIQLATGNLIGFTVAGCSGGIILLYVVKGVKD